MKVKVIKVSKWTYWYSDEIGETFEVEDKIEVHHGIPKYRLKKIRSRLLSVEDTDRGVKEFIFR